MSAGSTDCSLDHDGAGAGAHRIGHPELARLRSGATEHQAAFLDPRPTPPQRVVTKLPAPVRSCEVDQLTVVPPGSRAAIVNDVGFRRRGGRSPGDHRAERCRQDVAGRALVGIWPAVRGNVRLDGARTDQWDPAALGRHVGFVSQNVDLFDGTIAENISRMAPKPDSEAVLKAARAAGARHDREDAGRLLSPQSAMAAQRCRGGQRQRIALAQALRGPFLLVLDEGGLQSRQRRPR